MSDSSSYKIYLEFQAKMEQAFSGINRFNAYARAVNSTLDKTSDKLAYIDKLSQKLGDYSATLMRSGAVLGVASGAMAAGATSAVMAYASLEEQQKILQSTMMDSNGAISQQYGELIRLGDTLGKELPGESKDMIDMFINLRQQGIQATDILNGVGESTAKLAVVMGTDFSTVAEYMGQFKNSMDIKPEDMVRFSDLISRLKYAAGVNLTEMGYTFANTSAALKNLGVTGIENAPAVAAIMGIMKQSGIEGMKAGTQFSTAMGRIAVMQRMLATGHGKEVQSMLSGAGVQLNFFDDKGQFRGIENMMVELQKLKTITNQQQRMDIIQTIFGSGSDEAMGALINAGASGYNEMIGRLQNQADLSKKTDLIMSSINMRWDTFKGTSSQVFREFGKSIAETIRLVSILNGLNKVLGKIGDFMYNHPNMGRVFAIGVVSVIAFTGALAGILMLSGGTLFVLSQIASGVRNVALAAQYMIAYGPQIRAFFTMLKVTSLSALRAMAMGIWGAVQASWAFIASPIGIALAAVAVVAFLVYKYWDKITYAIKFWWNVAKWAIGGVLNWMKGLSNGVLMAIAVFAPFIGIPILLWKNWDKIKPLITGLWSWIKGTFSNIWSWFKGNWTKLLSVFLYTNPITAPFMILKKLFKWLFEIDLFKTGVKIITTLFNGLKSVISKPIKAVEDMVWSMRRFLPSSPAKEGPFKELHRIKIAETIASTIRPAPAIMAMRNLAGSMAGVALPGRPTLSAARGGGINVTINLGNIHLSGTNAMAVDPLAHNIKQAVEKALREIETDRMRRRY